MATPRPVLRPGGAQTLCFPEEVGVGSRSITAGGSLDSPERPRRRRCLQGGGLRSGKSRCGGTSPSLWVCRQDVGGSEG